MTKTELKEAARVLKSGGSKKRERRVAASTMSEAGSSKGGQARARNLTPEQLTEIARLGASGFGARTESRRHQTQSAQSGGARTWRCKAASDALRRTRPNSPPRDNTPPAVSNNG